MLYSTLLVLTMAMATVAHAACSGKNKYPYPNYTTKCELNEFGYACKSEQVPAGCTYPEPIHYVRLLKARHLNALCIANNHAVCCQRKVRLPIMLPILTHRYSKKASNKEIKSTLTIW